MDKKWWESRPLHPILLVRRPYLSLHLQEIQVESWFTNYLVSTLKMIRIHSHFFNFFIDCMWKYSKPSAFTSLQPTCGQWLSSSCPLWWILPLLSSSGRKKILQIYKDNMVYCFKLVMTRYYLKVVWNYLEYEGRKKCGIHP